VNPTSSPTSIPARYIRVEGGTDFLHFSQLVARDANNNNVAKLKTATSSGVWDYRDPNPSKAVDGVEDARDFPDIYHSSETNAWFEVDLGVPTIITSLTIYNRKDGYQDRLASGYKVKLLDVNRVVYFVSSPLTSAMDQTIPVTV
jgi:hypothetical protein